MSESPAGLEHGDVQPASERAAQQVDGDPGGNTADRSREERLARYLRARVAEGDTYFKSKYIAEDLGMTASEVGAFLSRLADSSEVSMSVERWGYSGSTTWQVTTEE